MKAANYHPKKPRCVKCPHYSEEECGKFDMSGHFLTDSLCWCCKKAVQGGCSWMDFKIPVMGWDAKKNKRDDSVTYKVISCPDFVRG